MGPSTRRDPARVGVGWEFAEYACRSAREDPNFTTMQRHITTMNISAHGDVAAAEWRIGYPRFVHDLDVQLPDAPAFAERRPWPGALTATP